MSPRNRFALALLALVYASWAGVTLTRHFAGSPDLGTRFLRLSPALACILALAALLCEMTVVHRRKLPWGYPPRLIPMPIRALLIAGVVFMDWRSLWLWFSWDGMFFFPSAAMLSLTLWRMKQSPRQALAASRRGEPRWGVPLFTRLTQEFRRRPDQHMWPRGPSPGGK